jgi:AcrR family transcriptional regulator
METSAVAPSRRSERSRLAILDAALALCREHGYVNVTIEAIAARAGVGKQTIYRWWPSKGAVLLDAFERISTAANPLRDTGDVVDDLRAFVTKLAAQLADDDIGPHLGALICEAQHDPDLRNALLERHFKPFRAAFSERIRTAQDAGQLSERLDIDALFDLIFGALYPRHLLHTGPLDRRYARFVVDTVIAGISHGE